MKTIFIIGPYNADSYERKFLNIQIAATAAKYLWSRKLAAICPHLNTAMFDCVAKEQVFYEGYQSILLGCSAAFVLPNWDSSKGSLGEIALAARLSIPLYYHSKFEPFKLEPKSISLLRRYVKECRKDEPYEPITAFKAAYAQTSHEAPKHMVSGGVLPNLS